MGGIEKLECSHRQAGLCIDCGYDLRGLSQEGACPECGTSIARSLAAGGFRYTNHRWLARMQIAAWMFAAESALLIFRVVLSDLPIPRPLWLLLVYSNSAAVTAVLNIVSTWLLTSPEPGRKRADRPAALLWARWLFVSSYGLSILGDTVFRQIWSPRTYGYFQTGRWLVTELSVLCLLLALGQYALRDRKTKASRRLEWAAALGILALLVHLGSSASYQFAPHHRIVWVWATSEIVWLAWLCVRVGAMGSFGLWMNRTTRRRGRCSAAELWRSVAALGAAMILGAIVGYGGGQFLLIQVARLGQTQWATMLLRLHYYRWGLGILCGAIFLPTRLLLLWRKLMRQRRERVSC